MITLSPQAFFFDFDGVIVDSEKAHMVAALKAASPHGLSFTELYYFEKLLGFDDVGLFRELFSENQKKLDDQTLKELMVQKNQEFMRLIPTHIIYFPGVVDFIKRLKDKKIPLAVVSGALRDEVISCLKIGGLDGYFDFIVTANDVTHSKPHPESYTQAFALLKVKNPSLEKNQCWALEDSGAGIQSAKTAGLKTIGITNSLKAKDLHEANYVIQVYDEITLL